LQAMGGLPPYVWVVSGGFGPLNQFPHNVHFDSSGIITSDFTTLVSAGKYTFSVQVTDSAGVSAPEPALLALTVSCGDANHERDDITAQYMKWLSADPVTGEYPFCQDFTDRAGNIPFPLSELNKNSGSLNWALIRLPLTIGPGSNATYGLHRWAALYNG